MQRAESLDTRVGRSLALLRQMQWLGIYPIMLSGGSHVLPQSILAP